MVHCWYIAGRLRRSVCLSASWSGELEAIRCDLMGLWLCRCRKSWSLYPNSQLFRLDSKYSGQTRLAELVQKNMWRETCKTLYSVVQSKIEVGKKANLPLSSRDFKSYGKTKLTTEQICLINILPWGASVLIYIIARVACPSLYFSKRVTWAICLSVFLTITESGTLWVVEI